MADQVELGFIGLGRWGHVLAEAANRTSAIRVVTGFARKERSRADFASRFKCGAAPSLAALLDSDIDGVVIATPHASHRDQIIAAATAGKHVFVEKPLALTVQTAREAIEATERAGVLLAVGHHRRRLPATRAIRRLMDDNEIGMLHLLEGHISAPVGLDPAATWHTDPAERPLGATTGLGVHMIDNFNYLAGRPARVSALSKRLLGRSRIDDVTGFLLEYVDGALALLATTLVTPRVSTLAAYGTAASAWSEEDGTRLFVQSSADAVRRETLVKPVDALAEQLTEFAYAIRGAAVPEVGPAAALDVVAVLEAGMRSVRLRRAVDLDEVYQQ